MSYREYLNCAKCGKNIGVTVSYRKMKEESNQEILCADCRRGQGSFIAQ